MNATLCGATTCSPCNGSEDLPKIQLDACLLCTNTPDNPTHATFVVDTLTGMRYGVCGKYNLHRDQVEVYNAYVEDQYDIDVLPMPDTITWPKILRDVRRNKKRKQHAGRGLQLDPFYPGCYPNDTLSEPYRRSFGIGLIIPDRLLQAEFEGSQRQVELWLVALMRDTNRMFKTHFNFHLYVETIYYSSVSSNSSSYLNATSGCSDPWLQPCEEEWLIQDRCYISRLFQLVDWRICLYQNYFAQVINQPLDARIGAWHLIDAENRNERGAGVAYVGSMCQPAYNTGVSMFSSNTFRTFTHELLHNFGADHPLVLNGTNAGEIRTDAEAGIMGYGPGTINGVYALDLWNRDKVCSTITESIESGLCAEEFGTLPPGFPHELELTASPGVPGGSLSPSTHSPTALPTVLAPPTTMTDEAMVLWIVGAGIYAVLFLACIACIKSYYKNYPRSQRYSSLI